VLLVTTRAADRRRRGLRLTGTAAAVLVGAAVLTYLLYALYLLVLAGEGSVPPRWRDPEVPSGAQVVSDTKECGSGGCWRQLVIRPTPGRTPGDLAAEMGLSGDEHQGWRWYDPHSVEIVVEVGDRDLSVSVRY
jgi:hypothetical protein